MIGDIYVIEFRDDDSRDWSPLLGSYDNLPHAEVAMKARALRYTDEWLRIAKYERVEYQREDGVWMIDPRGAA